MRSCGWLWLGGLLSTGCQSSGEPKDSPADTYTDSDTDTDTDTDTDSDECDGFVDLDGDGYGGAAATPDDCDESRVDNSLDCDDSDPAAGGGVEVPYNGRDEDCDPATPDDDLDGDGALVADDCNDQNPNSTTVATDADCDGVVTALDCDDTDPTSLVQALDADCDGAGTAEDCDDQDPELGSTAYDADCDGLLVGADCDDTDADIGDSALDADCDGTLTEEDCDDTNPAVPNPSDDDCDLVPYGDDCNDQDARYGDRAFDADCDRLLTADDCDDARGNYWHEDPATGMCFEGTDLGDLSGQQSALVSYYTMAPGGDLNADGHPDLVIERYPEVLVALGGSSVRQELSLGLATYELVAGDCGERPVEAVGVGDVDGDGHDDLMLFFPSCHATVLPGSVLVGGTPGSLTEIAAPAGALELTIAGDVWPDDLDGNGLTDLLVLGTDTSLGVKAPVQVYVFRDTTLAVATGPLGAAEADFVIDPGLSGSSARSVASVIDLDGDGLRELALGSGKNLYFTDRSDWPGTSVYIHHTSALSAGPATPAQQEIVDSVGDFDNLGSVLLSDVDIDGDGVDDLILSGSRDDETYYSAGIAVVSGAQLAAGGDIDIQTDAALVVPRGSQGFGGGEYFGENLVSLGDIDGDGFPEVFASDFNECCYTDHYFSVFSWAHLFWGERTTQYQGGYLGEVSSVADRSEVHALGDLDGDGHDDLALGSSILWGPIIR